MKCKATKEQMERRRQDRLRRLVFFMSSRAFPEMLGRDECLNLLTGWFLNSKWAVCRFILRRAIADSWRYFLLDVQTFWHRRICRRTREELLNRMFGPDDDEQDEGEEWPEEVEV